MMALLGIGPAVRGSREPLILIEFKCEDVSELTCKLKLSILSKDSSSNPESWPVAGGVNAKMTKSQGKPLRRLVDQ